MDQGTLVRNKIDEGEVLVEQLTRSGFDVTAAFWVRPSEEGGGWLLYVASKVVDEEGPAAAYRAVYDALDRLPDPWVSMSEIKVIGANHPIAKDALEVHRQLKRPGPARSPRPRLGNLAIEELYVYPPLPATALAGVECPIEMRKLKGAVEQVPRADELLQPFTAEENSRLAQLVKAGMERTSAEYWIRKHREASRPRPPIPAGSVVKARLAGWWGNSPKDDPDPLLLVESQDGAHGLTNKANTEPV